MRFFFLPAQCFCSIVFRSIVCLKIFDSTVYTENERLMAIISISFRALYLFSQSIFGVLWYLLLTFFTRAAKSSRFNCTLILGIYTLSTLLLVDHFTLIVCGALEFYQPSTYFYNVFCTFLYVIEPVLTFVTAIALLYLFTL